MLNQGLIPPHKHTKLTELRCNSVKQWRNLRTAMSLNAGSMKYILIMVMVKLFHLLKAENHHDFLLYNSMISHLIKAL